ncbi:MAG TPA: hypothetical protein VKT77_08520 [Chthonomonadaceae bacterium]|nr:hypothetical protein [Chthonomonadaceae bacterium]
MRKADVDVREVVCSETGKPMAKIPLWMADVKVKFISDEAKQKHPAAGLADLEPLRRSSVAAAGELEEIKESVVAGLDDADGDADVEELEDLDEDLPVEEPEE